MSNKSLFLFAVMLLTSIAFFNSCTKNKTEDIAVKSSTCDSSKTISYKNDVQPILNNNCGAQAGCHSNGSASGGVKLESWQGTNIVAESGLLMKSIKHESGAAPMPNANKKIDNCYIAIIEKWIKAGRLNN